MTAAKKTIKDAAKEISPEGTAMVSSAALAALLDTSSQTIRNLTRDGILFATKRYDRLLYDRDANTTRYVQYLHIQLSNKQKNETSAQIEERKLKAEADWKRSRADMAALQFAELEGKMHRSEDVAAVTADIVLSLRSLLTALPGRLAMDVAAASSSAEASEIIRAEVFHIMDAMAGYRYDPDQYRNRVRDRMGWEGSRSDEDAANGEGSESYESEDE